MSDPTTPNNTTDAAPAGSVAPTKDISNVDPATYQNVAPKEPDPKPDVKAEPAPKADDKAPAPDDKKSPLNQSPDPVKYEFKLPEGVTLEAPQLEAFSTLGNELKLSQESAQKLFDFHQAEVKRISDGILAGIKKTNEENITKTLDGWKAELNSDPMMSGSNAAKAQEILGKALDEYFSPEARQVFDDTLAGFNPHIVRGFLKMAMALTEGGPTPGGKPAGRQEPRTPGSVFYPNKSN